MVRSLVGYTHALKEIRSSLHALLHASPQASTLRLLPAIQFHQCSLYRTLDSPPPLFAAAAPPPPAWNGRALKRSSSLPNQMQASVRADQQPVRHTVQSLAPRGPSGGQTGTGINTTTITMKSLMDRGSYFDGNASRRKSIDSMLLQLIFSREAQLASMIVSFIINKFFILIQLQINDHILPCTSTITCTYPYIYIYIYNT